MHPGNKRYSSASFLLWRRAHPTLWARDDDARHAVGFQKIVQILFDHATLASRCVAHEYAVVFPNDDAAMEDIQSLASRCKKNQITSLQPRFQLSDRASRHA